MTQGSPVDDPVSSEIIASVLAAPPTLGSGRLVCVDGPAGSGKTTLAAALVRAADGLRVDQVHMDDVYEGWSGLEAGMSRVATSVVAPLRSGRPGRYRRYDWLRSTWADERVVEPVDVLVVEGVGSGNSAYDDAITCLVWVVAPTDLRLARGLERDGEAMRDQWLAWRDLEDAMFVRERTRARADVVIDGTDGQPMTLT